MTILVVCSINIERQRYSLSYYSDSYNPTNKKFKRYYRVTFSIISIAFVGKVNKTEHGTSSGNVIYERNCSLSKFTNECKEEKAIAIIIYCTQRTSLANYYIVLKFL